MKISCLLLHLCAAFGLLLNTSTLQAQTCRINSGCVNGVQSYIEVYEYDYVDRKPEFPGGDSQLVNFINKNRRYPTDAYRNGIQGRVMCSFVVNADGSVSNITVLKGVEQTLNREAIRIFSKMPSWKPGMINGKAVPVRVIWPVPFRR